MPLDERTLALVALAVAVATLVAWVALLQRSQVALRRRLRRILADVEGGGIDEILDTHLRRLEALSGRIDALNALQRELEEVSRRTVQRIGVVRFNPFPDTGGDQSFAIALLDTLGNGLVLSSLHGRADTRLFAKPVVGGRSRYQLSGEEQDAIRQALAPADLGAQA